MNSTHINTLSNIAASAEDNGNNDNSNVALDSFERETGWSFADALDMAAEARREERLFGNRSNRQPGRSARRTSTVVDLESAIGWGPGAVVDFIAENRREERLFGRTPLYV